MQDKDKPEILIIRRGGHTEFEEHHGGVWKIAYADFMTAMMAFFLVMWLVNVTDPETKENVARYFNPIRFAEATVERKGIRDPETKPKEGENEAHGKGDGPAPKGPAKEGPGASAPGRQTRTEATLFQDPYAVLASIAEKGPAEPNPTDILVEAVQNDGSQAGLTAGDQVRDPFDPIYWQAAPRPTARGAGESRGAPGPTDASAAMRVPAPGTPGETKPGDAKAGDARPGDPKPGDARPATAKPGTQRAADAKGPAAAPPLSPEAAAEAAAEQKAAELRQSLSETIGKVAAGSAPEIRVEGTREGILVSLTDAPTFGMFPIGSAEPRPEVLRIVEKVAQVLAKQPGMVVVRGHTDGRPFRSREYDNWRLSSARAQMAAYMLMRGGLPESRIERIEGWADRSLKVTTSPEAAANRRIEILVREVRP